MDTNNLAQNDPGNTQDTPGAMSADMVHAQLSRILAYPLFQQSKRSSDLLKYIVHHALLKDGSMLTGRSIGIHVFGHTAEHDASLDSTVRVAATEVRRRLALYYSEPGHDGELHIQLPNRSYMAEFSLPAGLIETPLVSSRTSLTGKRRLYLLLAGLCVCLLLSLFAAQHWLVADSSLDRFWSPFIRYSGAIPISVSSLNAQTESSNEQTPDSDLPQSPLPLAAFIPRQIMITSSKDIVSAISIASFLGHYGKSCFLQTAQNTSLEKMKHQPALLIGGFGNEWAIRMGRNLRFTFQQDSASKLIWVQDSSNPASRAWSVNPSESYRKDRNEFALVTRAVDRSTGQWWIGVAGLTGLGTVVAQQMFLDPSLMAALEKMLPEDWEKKNLQVVLQISIVKESPGTPQVIAIHTW